MELGFDVISDLCLTKDTIFDWNNKATSIYCIVAGNISSDTNTIISVLSKLSLQYARIFYVPGYLEYDNIDDIEYRTDELSTICDCIGNVTMLYQCVTMIGGVAIAGANGWGIIKSDNFVDKIKRLCEREADIMYLEYTLEKLQCYLDTKKIIMVSSAVPKTDLYFNQQPDNAITTNQICECLEKDTGSKVSTWVFGTYKNVVDVTLNNINYVSNPMINSVYWPKRITISI